MEKGRPGGVRWLAAVFALLAGLDAWQLLQAALGAHPDPASLLVTHGVTGVLAGAAAAGSWRSRPWAVWAVLAWGAATAGMLMVLGPVLEEPVEEWRGLWLVGAVVAALSALAAWHLHRRLAQRR